MKKSFQFLIGTTIILVSFLATSIRAQDCGCGAALVKDKIVHSEEGFDYLHSLLYIDISNYEEIKKSFSGSGQYGIIGGSASVADLKKNINEAIKRTEVETGQQYKSSYYESQTSPIAYEAWSRCMELCVGKGLFLWISDEDENTIVLKLKYNPPPNSSKINFTLEIKHANGSTEQKTDVIGLNETKTIYVKRGCGSKNGHTKTYISINGGGYSSDRTSKYYCGTPPPLPCLNTEQIVNVGGNSRWIPLDKLKSTRVEIYWSNSGNDGTAQIGVSQSLSPSSDDINILPLDKQQKITLDGYIFVRSGFVNGGANADKRPAFIRYKFVCD